jgi:hypothetical protein
MDMHDDPVTSVADFEARARVAIVRDLEIDGATRAPDRTDVLADGSVRAHFDGLGTLVDTVVPIETAGPVVVIERRLALRGRGRIRPAFGVRVPMEPLRWVVPGVMYDGNRVGEGRFPTGGPQTGWSFREDRVTLPSASFVGDDTRWVGLWTTPATTEPGLTSIRTLAKDGHVTLSVEFPFVEEPWAYRGKHAPFGFRPTPRRGLDLAPGLRYSHRFYVFLGPPGVHGYAPAFRYAWERVDPPSIRPDWGAIVAAKAGHVASNHFYRRGRAAGFIGTLTDAFVPFLNSFSAGFLGKNLELALSLFRIGRETGQDELPRMAVEVADFFQGGRLPNGLFLTDYQLGRGRWCGLSYEDRKEVNTRIAGEAAVCLLRLHAEAGRAGVERPAWRDQAVRLGDFFVENLPEDGNPGKWWSVDGRRADDTGTNGAYIVSLLAALHRETGDARYREAMRRGADFFADQAVRGDLSGDTLDALCIDKEAGHAVLRALLDAFGEVAEPRWLEGAVAAARFTDTWTFAWDVPFGPDTACGRRGFRTTGGTTVSVAHHHLDPYGVAIALDYLRLHRATGDEHWLRTARHLIAYCGQLVSRPGDRLGHAEAFDGFQPEQVQHTDWAYWSNVLTPRGSFYSNIGWVHALTLGALLDLRASFPEEVSFGIPRVSIRRPAWFRRAIRGVLSRVNRFG